MNKRIIYIQIALEAALPVLGFFWWDWSLYFILLFYFFDLFAKELTVQLKANQINKYQEGKSTKSWLAYALASIGLLVLSLILIHVGMRFEHPSIDFLHEAIAFWKYEELGLQQGYVFFPLALYVAYQEYKMQFLLPARYRKTTMKAMWKDHLIGKVVLLFGSTIACFVLVLTPLPEIVIVLSIITIVAGYSIWVLNYR